MSATEMLRFDLEQTDDPSARIAALEARVARLEAALARLDGTVPGRPAGEPDEAAAAAPLPADPLPSDIAAAKTVKLPILDTGPETRASLDKLGITASFAMLDERVAEAAAEEAAVTSRPVWAGPVAIDESLIDRAFARPAPQRINVVSYVEEFHPKIAERITSTWRTNELSAYLKRLIVDDRGDRAGFAPGVMSELLMLSAVLEAPPETDRWNANARAV